MKAEYERKEESYVESAEQKNARIKGSNWLKKNVPKV
jgi:hypothetical protein